MNQRHPMDDLFRRKLENHSMSPPMHLWDAIDKKRNKKRPFFLYWRNLIPTTLGFVLLIGAISWFLIPTDRQSIQNFPIPMTEGKTQARGSHHTNESSASASTTIASPTLSEYHPQKPAQTSSPPMETKQKIDLTTIPPIANSTPFEPNSLPTLPEKVLEENENAPNETIEAEAEHLPLNPDLNSRQSILGLDAISSRPLEELAATSIDYQLPKVECADFNRRSLYFTADIMAGPAMALREFEPSDEEYQNYAQLRENSETPTFAYNVSARISAVTGFGLALRTGLSYTQFNEQFKYRNENEERIIITNRYDTQGNIIGTDTIVETGTREVITHNRYSMLDVPILAGYEFGHKKFSFSVNGGILLNVMFDQKGQFLSPNDLKPASFSKGQPGATQPFRQTLAMGWYGSLGIQYEMKHQISLLVEPYFRIDPQPFTKAGYIVQQRYFTTGLSIGLRKRL